MTNNDKYQLAGAYIISGMVVLKTILPHLSYLKGKTKHNKIIKGKWLAKKR